MTSALNIQFNPEIINRILDYAVADDEDPATLVKFGLVCQDWDVRIGRKIGYHLITSCDSIYPNERKYRNRWDAVHDVRNKSAQGVVATQPIDLKTWKRCLMNPECQEGWAADGSLEFDTLRPALYPGRDVCDFDTRDCAALVREAKVLTASTWIYDKWSADRLAEFCPRLHTIRIVSYNPRTKPSRYPKSQTYVWFRAPDTHISINDMYAPPAICHSEARKLVFVNQGPLPSFRPELKATPRVVRPANVAETVFILYARPYDGIEHWIQWSVDCGFRTTVVLETETAEGCEKELRSIAPTLMEDELVEVVTAEAYRERVGEETFREETQLHISPTEKTNAEKVVWRIDTRGEQERPWRRWYEYHVRRDRLRIA